MAAVEVYVTDAIVIQRWQLIRDAVAVAHSFACMLTSLLIVHIFIYIHIYPTALHGSVIFY